MIKLYEQPRTAFFNGYINTSKIDTVPAIVEANIIGETANEYVTEIREGSTPMWDELGRYETYYCYTIGFHKSRLINYKQSEQLKLFIE